MVSDNIKKLTKEQITVLNDLYSNDDSKINKSISKLRENGGLYGIEPLMDIYFNTLFPEIRKNIENLFSDIKENKISEIILTNLPKYLSNQYLSSFMSTLWQTSIKFENLKIFIDIFINSDNKTAFECVTIIEQNVDYSDINEKKACVEIIKSNIDKLEGFKKDLAENLLDIMK